MTKIGLLRCAKNSATCPLTSCLRSMRELSQGFAGHQATELVGVFTLGEDQEQNLNLAKILKAKGAEAIHLVTCGFAHKEDGKWVAGNGCCPDPDGLLSRIAREVEVRCVKGSAHLPEGYVPEVFP